jgi:hypothetical protein
MTQTTQLLKDFDALLEADFAKAQQDLADFKKEAEEFAQFNHLQNEEKDAIFVDSYEYLNLQLDESAR